MPRDIIRTIACCIIGFYAMSACAQHNAMDALRTIAGSYNSKTPIRFTGSMKMYAKNKSSVIIDQLNSSYIMQNRNFRCNMGEVLMLLNDDYYVTVNNSDRVIMIGRRSDLPSLADNPALNLQQLEKWLMAKKIQASVSVNGANTVLYLADTAAASGFKTYNIVFNAANGYMKKVVMETAANAAAAGVLVLEIRYSEPLPAANVSFSEKPFFAVVNNKLVLAAAYRNYQLISQL